MPILPCNLIRYYGKNHVHLSVCGDLKKEFQESGVPFVFDDFRTLKNYFIHNPRGKKFDIYFVDQAFDEPTAIYQITHRIFGIPNKEQYVGKVERIIERISLK